MKLSDYRNTYYEFSSLTSTCARQLAFAGIAIVWIFKQQTPTAISLPQGLLLPTIALILSLGLDLLQYLFATLFWKLFAAHYTKRYGTTNDPEISAPYWPQRVVTFLFLTKVLFVLLAYAFLLHYCARAVNFG